MSHEFFKAVSDKPARHLITELCTDSRRVTTGHSEVEEVCMRYYCNLFDSEGSVPPCKKEEVDCLSAINHSVSDFMAQLLAQPIIKSKLYKALKIMVLDKAPGSDGTATKKFIIYWEIIGSDYTEMIRAAITSGSFPKGVCSGLITLMWYLQGGWQEVFG